MRCCRQLKQAVVLSFAGVLRRTAEEMVAGL